MPASLTSDHLSALAVALADVGAFSRCLVGLPLRPYQLAPARAIVRAALRGPRDLVVVLMARQAGKNQLSAHVEAYLMLLDLHAGGSIVKCAPTFKPQLITSMLRLRHVLASPLLPRQTHAWGYIHGLGRATTTFLSAEPTANVVGATASRLLEFDEAQDIDPTKHDRDFLPMAASTNAPRAYYGTAWRADDLLQTAKSHALELQRADGVPRLFEYPWEAVAEHNPTYGDFVRAERRRLGDSHPIYLTQYCLQPVATLDGLFDPRQLRALVGHHPRHDAPADGASYVMGVDLGGPAELDPRAEAPAREHDSTAVTIGQVVLEGLLPAVRVVRHFAFTGLPHADQFELLRDLIAAWRVRRVVVDATGLGSAPAENLRRAFGDERVLPFLFTSRSKSDLGFHLLAWVNTGQLTHYAPSPDDPEAALFLAQARAVRRTLLPSRLMKWENPRGHDDLVVSTALCAHAALHQPPPTQAFARVAPTPFDQEDY